MENLKRTVGFIDIMNVQLVFTMLQNIIMHWVQLQLLMVIIWMH